MKKTLASLGLAMVAFLGAASASAAIVVSFNPSSQHVNVGDSVSIDVSISGLGAEILSAFDLNFKYNGSILGAASRAFDGTTSFNQLGGSYGVDPLYDIDIGTNGDMRVVASAFADDATVAENQANDFLLIRFGLSADADGATTFGLGADPDFERNFVGLNFASLNVNIGSACIAVGTGTCETVPEPGSYALVGVALLAAGATSRRLRRRRSGARV